MTVRRLLVAVALLAAGLSLALALPTRATTVLDTDTTETGNFGEDTIGDETSGTEAGQEDDDDVWVALGVLGFGAAALAMTLLYMNGWRKSSTDLIKTTLETTGALPDAESVSPQVAPAERTRGMPGEAAPPQIVIRGPVLLHVGRRGRFRAFQNDAPVEVQWSVDPADAAQVDPAAGDTTRVTATRLGRVTVRATAGGATAEHAAVVVAAPRRAGRVPVVGAGFGGITIAIIALTLAAAATAYGKLDGAALVALAGAVVGYFFVEARGQQQQEQQAGDTAGAGMGAGMDTGTTPEGGDVSGGGEQQMGD